MRGLLGTPPVIRAQYWKNGTLIKASSKVELERASIKENIRRFSLPNKTPFMTGSLLQSVGYLAEKDGREAILDGNYGVKPDVSPIVTDYIASLARPLRTSIDVDKAFTISKHIEG